MGNSISVELIGPLREVQPPPILFACSGAYSLFIAKEDKGASPGYRHPSLYTTTFLNRKRTFTTIDFSKCAIRQNTFRLRMAKIQVI